jgi:hypothetical protein
VGECDSKISICREYSMRFPALPSENAQKKRAVAYSYNPQFSCFLGSKTLASKPEFALDRQISSKHSLIAPHKIPD